MSPRLHRDVPGGDHGRARELAALSMDEPLGVADARWLDAHLAGCAPCRAVAAAYDEQRSLVRTLRDSAPVPPRDLWARTSAAMDDRRGGGVRRPTRSWAFGRMPLAPAVGLLVVAIAVGAGLLNGVSLIPGTPGSDSPALPTPIALTAGNVQVVTLGADGALELSTRNYDAVCPVGTSQCGTSTTSDRSKLSTLADLGSFDAFISPSRDHILVMPKDAGATGIYVIPVRSGPTPTPSPKAPTAPPPSPTPATGSPSVSPDPSISPEPPASPSASPADSPSPTPVVTDAPTESAQPSGSAEPTDSAPPPTDAPSPSPSIAVTPAPDGTIQIAHDVTLVGSISGYSADGTLFAFTARPAAGTAGPDVFVWRTTELEARPVTTDHGSLFSAWIGNRLLVSRVVDGAAVTVELDPATGIEQPVLLAPMWRPTVSPDGRLGAWWEGTVAPAADGSSWVPAEGRLVLGPWPGGGSADKILATGSVRDWQIRWDETGTSVALWISNADAGLPGRLSLFAVDPQTGAVDLAAPLLADAPAYEGFALRAGSLVWSAPADGGATTVEVLAWSGDAIGRLQLPTESGVAVLR